MVKKNCVVTTAYLKMGPGFFSSIKVIRCILSFSASSSKVWIQPEKFRQIDIF